MKKSIGLLEVRGLAGAIRVADTMAKSASVDMLGIETAKGGGWMVKVRGDVAAVQSSVSSGSALAKQLGCHVAQVVLSRPDQQLIGHLVQTAPASDGEKSDKADKTEKADESEAAKKKASVKPTKEKTSPAKESKGQNAENTKLAEEKPSGESPAQTGEEASCNLCGDPACPRMRGEPHTKCLHNGKGK